MSKLEGALENGCFFSLATLAVIGPPVEVFVVLATQVGLNVVWPKTFAEPNLGWNHLGLYAIASFGHICLAHFGPRLAINTLLNHSILHPKDPPNPD